MFPTKPSTFRNMHHRGLSTKEADRSSGTTSLTVTTGVPVGGFRIGDCNPNFPAFIQILWGYRRNWHRGKSGKDDGAI